MTATTRCLTSTDTKECSTVDIRTVVTVLAAAGRAHVPVLFWGAPGVGKSSLIRGLARAEDVPCETVIGSLREPSDFAGLPIVADDNTVRMAPPAWARRLADSRAGYLFLDELSTAAPAVQAAMLGVALDKQVGDLSLPRDVRIVAAANPPEQAADGWDLTPPLANRFLHLDYSPTGEDWISGMTAGFGTIPAVSLRDADAGRRAASRALVAAFIKVRPNLLDSFPADPTSSGRAWPSRRTWTMTADTLAFLPDSDESAAYAVAVGLVGEGAGVEFLTWRREADLPDPVTVLADPASVKWTDRPDRVWAILAGVVGYCTGRGTVEAWRDAWGPLAAASEAGAGDVAAAVCRNLLAARPANASIPREAKALTSILRAAGLLTKAAA